jgi:DNA-binding response OmpR family regulator
VKLEAEPRSGKRILLVEDDRVLREILRRLFVQDSHTVVEATNGAEGLALFCKGAFDLVVTDFEMPFLKGDELARRIKKIAPNQAILMITAFSHRPGMDNPVDAIVTKPCGSACLREIIGKLLSRRSENADSQQVFVETAAPSEPETLLA